METETIENPDSQPDSEEHAGEDFNPQNAIKSLEAQFNELNSKNSQIFERFKKFESAFTKTDELSEKKKEGPSPDEISKRLDDTEQRVELRMKGYSPDEVAEIVSYAKATGKTYAEAEKSPFVKKGIEGLRAEQTSDKATPPPSNRIARVRQSIQDFGKTPKEEREARFGPQSWINRKRSNSNE